MILRVTDKNIETDLSTMVISISDFNDIAFHPWLSTAEFDAIVVDIEDNLRSSYLKQVFRSKQPVIPVINSYPISAKQYMALASILPDKIMELKKAYADNTMESYMTCLYKEKLWERFV